MPHDTESPHASETGALLSHDEKRHPSGGWGSIGAVTSILVFLSDLTSPVWWLLPVFADVICVLKLVNIQ